MFMATHVCKELNSFHNNYQKLLKSPELFISVQDSAVKNFKVLTKDLYDFTKSWETKENITDDESLPELIIRDFDDEQVWQQLELKNGNAQTSFLKNISSIVTKSGISLIPRQKIIENGDNDVNEAESVENFTSDDDDESPPPKRTKKIVKKPAKRKPRRTTVVDDQFFKIDELEEYLEQEENKEENKNSDEDDEDIDFFRGPDEMMDEDDKSGRHAKYEDFFDPPDAENAFYEEEHQNDNNEDVSSQEEDDDDQEEDEMEEDEESEEEEGSDNSEEIGNIGSDEEYDTADYDPQADKDVVEPSKHSNAKLFADDNLLQSDEDEASKSTYEKRQEKVKKKIAELEESNLAEKPWQLQGEIAAGARPENSLLQEDVQFTHTTRQAPVITEETTKSLESIIIQRIKDQAWDDVIRKEKPKEEAFEFKKRIVLDQEKSKAGLAEIYEQEYLKQKNKDNETKKETPEHEDIKKMMSKLFSKLDALSNYSYTPKPRAPEIKIVSNLPAITAEEVAPSSVSDGALLAPEEVLAKTPGELKSKAERTKEDKKHDRRKNKSKARLKKKEKEKREKMVKKLNPGLGNKYSQEDALKSLEKMGANTTIIQDKKSANTRMTSKKFFAKLDERTSAPSSQKKKNGNMKDK